ncbi:MAG TPA: hypothetical protein VKG25_11605 [Bryobacteraceae bacterium]|nr:hypothetical protein [Bryobacteraceae bacterium]
MTRVGLAFILYMCVANLQAQQDPCYIYAYAAALGCSDGFCRAYIYSELARCEAGEMTLPPAPPAPPSPPTPCGQQRQARPGHPLDADPRTQSSSSVSPCITFLDPVPDLVNSGGTDLVTATATLAQKGTLITGIATEGAARALVRLYANAAGDRLILTLLSGDTLPVLNGLQQPLGTLKTIRPADRNQSGTTVTVTAVDTQVAGIMAFVTYIPPEDFSRGGFDDTSPSRTVKIQVRSSSTTNSYTAPLTLWRPPVVLLHGLWGGPDDFQYFAFDPTATSPGSGVSIGQFWTQAKGYNDSIVVANALPIYDLGILATNAKLNDMGFTTTAPFVLEKIRETVNTFRAQRQAAGTQADIVGHSMGGLVARAAVNLPGYPDAYTFSKGAIHKIVTVGTPHLGSPLAYQLLLPSNQCTRSVIGAAGRLAFQTAQYQGQTASGAVGNLVVSSQALTDLASGGSGLTIRAAFLAGATSISNLYTLDSASVPRLLRAGIGCPNDPLPQSFTSARWNSDLFGTAAIPVGVANDGVVSVTSQFNGLSSGYIGPGLIHSRGLETLGFSAPSELDDPGISGQVRLLLNAPRSGTNSVFFDVR